MYFKSFVVLRLPDESYCGELLGRSDEDGPEALDEQRAIEPAVTQMRSMGLTASTPHWPESLIYPIPGTRAVLMAVRHYERVVPRQAVLDKVKAEVTRLESKDERHVTAKEQRQLVEQTVIQMLPSAFIQHKTTHFIVDGAYVYVAHTANKVVEDICGLLRAALGSFPARRMTCEADPVSTMTSSLHSKALPGDLERIFQFGTSVHIRHADGDYRVKDVDIVSDPAIDEVLSEGATVHRLGLIFNDQVSFVIDGDFAFRGIKTLDTYNEMREEADPELPDYKALIFDADMLLWISTVRELREAVTTTFGGERDPETRDKTKEFANLQLKSHNDSTAGDDDFDL